MSKSGIYKILNLVNGKFYIGSAVNFKNRKSHHYGKLRRNVHDNKYLQRAFNKYGEENFDFIILEYVNDKSELIKREQYYLDKFKTYKRNIGYNICPTAGSQFGYKFSDESKQKISNSLNGNIPWNKGKKGIYSEETLNKIRLSKIGKPSYWKGKKGIFKGEENPMWGKKHSKETKEKISNTLKTKGFNVAHGEKHYKSKKVIQLNKKDEIINQYNTITLASEKTGISKQCICYCCKGTTKTAGGYKWKYAI